MCQLARLYCSVFLCFFSDHVLLFSTVLLMDTATWGRSVHQVLFAKSHLGNVSWLHLSFEYRLSRSPIPQKSLRSRGREGSPWRTVMSSSCPNHNRSTHPLSNNLQSLPICHSCWDGDAGWANTCTVGDPYTDGMPHLSLQLPREVLVQEWSGICWLKSALSNVAVICYVLDHRHSWGSFPECELTWDVRINTIQFGPWEAWRLHGIAFVHSLINSCSTLEKLFPNVIPLQHTKTPFWLHCSSAATAGWCSCEIP